MKRHWVRNTHAYHRAGTTGWQGLRAARCCCSCKMIGKLEEGVNGYQRPQASSKSGLGLGLGLILGLGLGFGFGFGFRR